MRTFLCALLLLAAAAVTMVGGQSYTPQSCRDYQDLRHRADIQNSQTYKKELFCEAYGKNIECAQERYDQASHNRKDILWEDVKTARRIFTDYGCSGASSPQALFFSLIFLPAAIFLGRGLF